MRQIFKPTFATHIFRRNYCVKREKCHRQIFSAIQPTGKVHLGNYLGALKKWVDLQNNEENVVIYGIADLHSITLPKDPEELQKNILTMAATILACGIDIEKSILFQQSAVPQHTNLCWVLGTLTTMAKLSHLPQYKEKCELVKDPGIGIFLYPVLQTADIMLYRATHVPVGQDQIHQIQLAQHLIRLFNKRFGSEFPVPNPLIDESYGKIKNLQDPTKKMSKSDLKENSVIGLMDEPDVVFLKIKKAVTDFNGQVTFEPDVRFGVSNLVLIHSAITGKTPQEIVEESMNLNTGKYKLVLADALIEYLNPIRKRIIDYLNCSDYLVAELEKGAEKAQEIAERTMKEIKEIVGFDLLNVSTADVKQKANRKNK